MITWHNFVKALNILQAKSVDTKTDLIMKILNADKIEFVQYKDIYYQSKSLLKTILNEENSPLLEDLSHCITRSVFKALNIQFNQPIPV
jgi:hypothetical protein